MLTEACCHSTGDVGTGWSLGFLASQFTLITEFQPSEKACLKGAGQFLRGPPKVVLWLLYAPNTHMQQHSLECINMGTHVNP